MEMTLDRTLAFAALLEMDQSFRGRSLTEQAERISALLRDWYTDTGGDKPLWQYTQYWLSSGRSHFVPPEPSRRPGLTPDGPRPNVDKVDVAAGVAEAQKAGYTSPEHLMVIEYALMRHLRGEEEGAERSALSGGIDFTSWRRILAAAIVAAQ